MVAIFGAGLGWPTWSAVIFFVMNTTNPYHPILDSPLSELLGVTEEFIRVSGKLGFGSIRQMTDRGWGNLMGMRGFNYGWFNELVRYLDRHGLLGLLENR